MHGCYADDLPVYSRLKENRYANGQRFFHQQCEYEGKKKCLHNNLQKVQVKNKPIFL